MRCASTRFEPPLTTIIRFCGHRSSQCPGVAAAAAGGLSSPGSASVVAVGALVIDVAVAGDLTGRKPDERTGWDIFRDDRSRRSPSIVSNLDRSNERIVDCGPDVASDLRPFLRHARTVIQVCGHVARTDVGSRSDLSVADVRKMRHLGAFADL